MSAERTHVTAWRACALNRASVYRTNGSPTHNKLAQWLEQQRKAVSRGFDSRACPLTGALLSMTRGFGLASRYPGDLAAGSGVRDERGGWMKPRITAMVRL